MMESEKKSGHGLQVTIAIIGLFGALGTALIANWDKVFVPQPTATPVLINPTSGPTLAPPTSTSTPLLPTSTHTMVPSTYTPTNLPSPCEMLDGKSISVTQIGYNSRVYHGTVGPNGIELVDKGGGRYSFTTVVAFENDPVIDNVVGTCDENALTLTRTRPSIDFTQWLEGILTLANGVVTVNGTFTHTTSLDTYTWSGQIVNP